MPELKLPPKRDPTPKLPPPRKPEEANPPREPDEENPPRPMDPPPREPPCIWASKGAADVAMDNAAMANQRRMRGIIARAGALNCQIFGKHCTCKNLVLIPSPVFELAEFAIGWRQAVVNPMLHRLQSAHIGKHRLQIVVGEPAEFSKGHDGV